MIDRRDISHHFPGRIHFDILLIALLFCVWTVCPVFAAASDDDLYHPLDRILTEIDFARRLLHMDPKLSSQWRPLIEEAEQIVYAFISDADKVVLAKALEQADRILDEVRAPGDRNDYLKIPDSEQMDQIGTFIARLNNLNYRLPHHHGREPLEQAKEIVFSAISAGRSEEVDAAVRQAEQVMAPIGQAARQFTLHCIGHAHIDMNWQWSWEETVALTDDTFITVLKLMDEFPEFHFTQSQVSVYEIIRKYHPELFEKIKQRVAEGRWEIAAVQWVEGDKNMVSGESLAHHLLYSRGYLKEHFGLSPEDVPLDWEPDTFGHAHTIPSLVARGGVKYYYLCRGGRFDKPSLFWWQGPDGSRVLVNVENESWYLGPIGTHNVLSMLDFYYSTGVKDYMNVYGVGDHGGGPTRRDIKRILALNAWPVYPNFKMTAAAKYFQNLEKIAGNLPVLDRELNFEFTGCYTSQSQIKKHNRLGESKAKEAETAATLAYRILGHKYPDERIRSAWINVLFGHFHDILPGSNVRQSREYQSGLSQESFAITGMIKTTALRAMSDQINTSFAAAAGREKISFSRETAMGAGVGRASAMGGISAAGHVSTWPQGVVVFNPTAWPREETITVTLWDASAARNLEDLKYMNFIARTGDGRTIPAQNVDAGRYWGHQYVEIALPAYVDALGYTSYIIDEGDISTKDTGVYFRDDGNVPLTVENEYLIAEFDRKTGGIAKLVDKTSGVNMADPQNPMAALEFIVENGGNAWVIAEPRQRTYPLYVASMDKGLAGPIVATVTARLKINESTINVTYILRKGEPWIEIVLDAMWLERGSPENGTPTLRMQFPMALKNATAYYEIPYGSIERRLNAGEEVPGLRWADVRGYAEENEKKRAGCAVLDDGKYGYSLDSSTLRLTLIRSSYSPDPLPEIGAHTMRMALAPHGEALKVADLMRYGAAFNHALEVVNTDIHSGKLPSKTGALILVEPANILLTALKKAEGEDAVILRLLETEGEACKAKVRIDQTILGKLTEVTEVDFMERQSGKTSAKIDGDTFAIGMPPHGITSVKIKFAEKSF